MTSKKSTGAKKSSRKAGGRASGKATGAAKKRSVGSAKKKSGRRAGATRTTRAGAARNDARSSGGPSATASPQSSEGALTDVARSIGSTLGSLTGRARRAVKDATEKLEQQADRFRRD